MAWMLAELPELTGLGYRQAVDVAHDLEHDGHTAAALVYYRHAAQNRPTCFAWSGVGRCLKDQGDLEQAVDAFRTATEDRASNIGPALVSLIQTLVDLGRPMDAIEPTGKLLTTDLSTPPALYSVARCEGVDHDVADRMLIAAERYRGHARHLQPTGMPTAP